MLTEKKLVLHWIIKLKSKLSLLRRKRIWMNVVVSQSTNNLTFFFRRNKRVLRRKFSFNGFFRIFSALHRRLSDTLPIQFHSFSQFFFCYWQFNYSREHPCEGKIRLKVTRVMEGNDSVRVDGTQLECQRFDKRKMSMEISSFASGSIPCSLFFFDRVIQLFSQPSIKPIQLFRNRTVIVGLAATRYPRREKRIRCRNQWKGKLKANGVEKRKTWSRLD